MTSQQKALVERAKRNGPVWKIAVLMPNGKKTYKYPDELLPNDEILLLKRDGNLGKAGDPMIMAEPPPALKAKLTAQSPSGDSESDSLEDAEYLEEDSEESPREAAAVRSNRERKDRTAAQFQKNVQKRRGKNPLAMAVKKNYGGTEVLGKTLENLADQAALLSAMTEASFESGDYEAASKFALRTSQITRLVSETWLRQKEQSQNSTVDMASPAAQAYVRFLMQSFLKCMKESGVRQEQADTVFGRLVRLTQDPEWEFEAKSVMKAAVTAE